MTAKVRLPGKDGEWEEVGYSHKVEDSIRTYFIQEFSEQRGHFLFYRRAPSPPPMPAIRIGDGVLLDDLAGWVVTDGTYNPTDGNYISVSNSCGENMTIDCKHVMKIWRDNQSIWRRG